jgi:hypothetical protein
MKITDLPNNELLNEYNTVNRTYVELTLNSNVSDLHTLVIFYKAKDRLKTITKELQKRGLNVKK